MCKSKINVESPEECSEAARQQEGKNDWKL